jgi:hypothetical protein
MRRNQRGLAALLVIGLLIFLSAPSFSQDLPVDIVREKFLHTQNAVEESKITIKDSWGTTLPDSIRLGDDAYRPPPEIVLPSGWLAYVAQGVMGSWVGNCEALAFQNIDRA